nr:ABC transporter substrate-binding protein [Kineosphaera limosa]
MALVVSGCSAGPPEAGGVATSVASRAPISAPTAAPGTPKVPVTVTSDDSAQVEVASLERVLVLDDATIEIAHALGVGDKIAIAPQESLVPELADQAGTRIATAGQGALTVEGIVAFEPTLVVASNMRRHADLVTGLRKVSVPAVLIDTSQPAPDKIRKTAAVFGVAATGDQLATEVQAQIQQAAEKVNDVPEAQRPRVMMLSSSGAGDSGQTTAAGKSTPVHEIITMAGGINAGAEAGLDRFQSITAEGLIAARPEVIVVAQSELDDLGGHDGIWAKIPGLSGTPAAEKKSLIVMEDVQVRMSGVSTGVSALTLQSALYPGR